MKLLDIENCKNLTDHINITSEEIRNQIENYKLGFFHVRNEDVERKIKFPTFLDAFYRYVYLTKRIPTQKEFYTHYLNENEVFFRDAEFSSEITYGLKARIFRAYPSLVRDLHFTVYLSERFKEGKIIYNRALDVEEGIDILIVYKGNNWGISLYIDTARAHRVRELKQSRHQKYDNVKYAEMPVHFDASVKCGDFFLYGEKEYEATKRILK